MVIDPETLEPLHPLSEEGKTAYDNFLLHRADEIIFKSTHPFLWIIHSILNLFNLSSDFIEKKYERKFEEIKENRK